MSDINYVHNVHTHNMEAAKAFMPILQEFVQPNSVIDIGCGTGSWLKVFKDSGVGTILGVDGGNVDKRMLVIEESEFLIHDLRRPLKLDLRFDLAVCLEVAEHLPVESADNLVDILVRHSDTILFSAALPYQGGQNHINEKPFKYWVEKFNKRGFVVEDIFRIRIWKDVRIDPWYRQNMFLVTKNGKQQVIEDYYHPELFINLSKQRQSLIEENQQLKKEIRDTLFGRIPLKVALRIFVKSCNNLFRNSFTTRNSSV